MVDLRPAVELLPDAGVTTPPGFRAGAVEAGIRDGSRRLDLAVVVADAPCTAHGVFTQCQVVAPPVVVSRQRLASGRAQGIIVNSGNANACTGGQGLADARAMADVAADRLRVERGMMLVASTGVIGIPLPMDRLRDGISRLEPLGDGGRAAAEAIMTTDLVRKEYGGTLSIDGRRVTLGGMAKGSGMIHPNMGTMIAVVTTDAHLSRELARSGLQRAADLSFNQISVDGDTSTNDTLVLLANGFSGGPPLTMGSEEGELFVLALQAVCTGLARQVARDGEGASRLVEAQVTGGGTDEEARRVARAIVASNLVKAAIYGQDPNWGRIMAAAGNAGVALKADALDVFVGGVQVAEAGAGVPFDAGAVRRAMGEDEVQILVRLNQGRGEGVAWGCDLTESYVRINAEYTT